MHVDILLMLICYMWFTIIELVAEVRMWHEVARSSFLQMVTLSENNHYGKLNHLYFKLGRAFIPMLIMDENNKLVVNKSIICNTFD